MGPFDGIVAVNGIPERVADERIIDRIDQVRRVGDECFQQEVLVICECIDIVFRGVSWACAREIYAGSNPYASTAVPGDDVLRVPS